MKPATTRARVFIGAILFLGLVMWLDALPLHSADVPRFVVYLVIAMVASTLKIKLPGVHGTMSVYFLFTLLSVIELSRLETMVISGGAAILQSFWHAKKRPRLIQLLFNLADVTIATGVAYAVYHSPMWQHIHISSLPLLAIAATAFFVTNTWPVAAVIALTEGKQVRHTWQECYRWSFAYYLAGSVVASLLSVGNTVLGWQTALMFLPAAYLIYHSYRLYLDRLEGESKHAEEIASLHLRTIEALALAIDAKDHVTHLHLRRVQVYAVEIGRELGLSKPELDALCAAALLHDIGKLAVPEHIISKPGKLTPEEFEKMKIHPLVGAEILEQVRFPYSVAPIVRAHHEKWDGTGYPDGLKAEEIPMGARILSAVDCLDALASDRQYRRAIPLDKALEVVVSESGKSYDPLIVGILQRRCHELEELSRLEPEEPAVTAGKVIAKHQTPATADEVKVVTANDGVEFLESIAAARQEVQNLFELSQDLGKSLSLHETLSVLAARLQRLVRYDAIAVYVVRGDRLAPEYVSGDDFRLFSSLQIPMGEGISGWVAKTNKPIVNGNPSVEPGYLNDPTKFTLLRSALAVPLQGVADVIGVMTLYRSEKDAFTQDDFRVLLALVSKVSLSIENALKFGQAESSATTDYLTELPNARSLFLQLDSELARCRRKQDTLALLVCDLDGFKQVNDRFGHLQGNKILQLVGKRLRESCREYDYVARMGGDEFVMILTSVTQEQVSAKIEQLDLAVKMAGREALGEEIISLSIGSAFYPDDGANAEVLLAEADQRMYANKQTRKRNPQFSSANLDPVAQQLACLTSEAGA